MVAPVPGGRRTSPLTTGQTGSLLERADRRTRARRPRGSARRTPRRSPRRDARTGRGRSRRGRRACPTSIEPVRSSRWFTYAEPIVNAASAVGEIDPLLGEEDLPVAPPGTGSSARHHAVHGDVHLLERVGAGDAPVAAHRQRGPRPHQARERVLPRRPRWPRNGIVSSSICPSCAAQSGWAFATAPELRGTAGCRRDARPGCARGDGGDRSGRSRSGRPRSASSASRTARSASEWKCTWNPSASSRVTASFSSSGSTNEMPRFSVGCAVARRGTAPDGRGEVLADAVLHDLHAGGGEPARPCPARAASTQSSICSSPRWRSHHSAPTRARSGPRRAGRAR